MHRTYRSGLFALGVVGFYYLWRNRHNVQNFLQSRDINIPLTKKGETPGRFSVGREQSQRRVAS